MFSHMAASCVQKVNNVDTGTIDVSNREVYLMVDMQRLTNSSFLGEGEGLVSISDTVTDIILSNICSEEITSDGQKYGLGHFDTVSNTLTTLASVLAPLQARGVRVWLSPLSGYRKILTGLDPISHDLNHFYNNQSASHNPVDRPAAVRIGEMISELNIHGLVHETSWAETDYPVAFTGSTIASRALEAEVNYLSTTMKYLDWIAQHIGNITGDVGINLPDLKLIIPPTGLAFNPAFPALGVSPQPDGLSVNAPEWELTGAWRQIIYGAMNADGLPIGFDRVESILFWNNTAPILTNWDPIQEVEEARALFLANRPSFFVSINSVSMGIPLEEYNTSAAQSSYSWMAKSLSCATVPVSGVGTLITSDVYGRPRLVPRSAETIFEYNKTRTRDLRFYDRGGVAIGPYPENVGKKVVINNDIGVPIPRIQEIMDEAGRAYRIPTSNDPLDARTMNIL